MHRKIYKYPLRLIVGAQPITMAAGAIVRHFDTDPATGYPAIWAEVLITDPLRELPREFHIHATGDTVAPDLVYLRTLLQSPFVWHLFERVL